jgi:hypothetical protein
LISTFGNKDRETKNAVVLTTGWGAVYVPKAQFEKLGGDVDQVKITVEAVTA